MEAQPCGRGHFAKPWQMWPAGVVSWREVASFALCKPRTWAGCFWQVGITKLVQCFVTAQTFLKGLSKSWRTFDLPSCGKAGGVWGRLLTVEDVFCVFLSHSHTYTRTEPCLVTRAWGLTTEITQRGSHKEMGFQCRHPRPGTLSHLASAYLLANGEVCVG